MTSSSKYGPQYKYIKQNKEKYAAYSLKYYHKMKEDPERFEKSLEVRKQWRENNRGIIRQKQRENNRLRKLEAIQYKGGVCEECKGDFHPSVYEFHHLDPLVKDRDPSKMLSLKKETLFAELDKCQLLCANCHRFIHHGDKY